MKRLFLSYERNDADAALAKSLKAAFAAAGWDCFIDTDVPAGSRWAEEIDRAHKNAEVLVVLVSEESVLSDWVWREIERFYERTKQEKNLRIVPVHIEFGKSLPIAWDARLSPWNRLDFARDQDPAVLAAQLMSALQSAGEPSPAAVPADDSPLPEERTEPRGVPAPAADPRPPAIPAGTVAPDDGSRFALPVAGQSSLHRHRAGGGGNLPEEPAFVPCLPIATTP